MPLTLRRIVAFLALALLAGGSAAQALPAVRPAPAVAGPAGFLDALWERVAFLLAPAGERRPAATWHEAGSQMDPDGLLGQEPAVPSSDDGGAMDPNG